MDLAGFERSITFLCVMTPKLTYRPISYITFDTDETKGKDPRMKVWKVERYSVMVQLHQELAKLVLVQSLDQQSTIVEEEGIQLGSSVV